MHPITNDFSPLFEYLPCLSEYIPTGRVDDSIKDPTPRLTVLEQSAQLHRPVRYDPARYSFGLVLDSESHTIFVIHAPLCSKLNSLLQLVLTSARNPYIRSQCETNLHGKQGHASTDAGNQYVLAASDLGVDDYSSSRC